MARSLRSTLNDAVALLTATLKDHIMWAAEAKTHPALSPVERAAEYRFHHGYAAATNQARSRSAYPALPVRMSAGSVECRPGSWRGSDRTAC